MDNKEKRALLESLVINFKRIRLLEAKLFNSDRFNKEKIPYHHLMLLQQLTDEGPIPISKIKHEYNISASAATQFVNHLERSGYIHRIQHPNDKRSYLIELSDHGKMTVKRSNSSFIRETESLVDYLGAEDTKKLQQIIQKILKYYIMMEEQKHEQTKD